MTLESLVELVHRWTLPKMWKPYSESYTEWKRLDAEAAARIKMARDAADEDYRQLLQRNADNFDRRAESHRATWQTLSDELARIRDELWVNHPGLMEHFPDTTFDCESPSDDDILRRCDRMKKILGGLLCVVKANADAADRPGTTGGAARDGQRTIPGSPRKIARRSRNAQEAYEYAIRHSGRCLTDAEAHAWLKENGGPDGYELPQCKGTFSRYLRTARGARNPS